MLKKHWVLLLHLIKMKVSQCEIAVHVHVVETIGTNDSTNAIPEKDVEANESKDVQICQKR